MPTGPVAPLRPVHLLYEGWYDIRRPAIAPVRHKNTEYRHYEPGPMTQARPSASGRLHLDIAGSARRAPLPVATNEWDARLVPARQLGSRYRWRARNALYGLQP